MPPPKTVLHRCCRGRGCRPLAALLVTLAALAPAADAAAAADPLGAEAQWKLVRVGAPQLSQDGTRVVLPATRYDVAANEGTTDLY